MCTHLLLNYRKKVCLYLEFCLDCIVQLLVFVLWKGVKTMGERAAPLLPALQVPALWERLRPIPYVHPYRVMGENKAVPSNKGATYREMWHLIMWHLICLPSLRQRAKSFHLGLCRCAVQRGKHTPNLCINTTSGEEPRLLPRSEVL